MQQCQMRVSADAGSPKQRGVSVVSGAGRADTGAMAASFGRRYLRLAVLVAIAVALAAALLTQGRSAANGSHVSHTDSSLTAAQKTAAVAALEAIAPPKGFRRYEEWAVATSAHSPSVRCLPEPSICFGSGTPLRAVNARSTQALLARFGIRTEDVSCIPQLVESRGGTCDGFGSFSGYELGMILTVVHPGAGRLKPGSQVVLFVVRTK